MHMRRAHRPEGNDMSILIILILVYLLLKLDFDHHNS
jgi:hypothetical protein